MQPLFDRLGIQILSCFSGDAKFEELRYAHRAKLNVIICSKSLTNLAKKMQKNFGMPYIEESFYGMTDTAKALRDIARELDDTVGGWRNGSCRTGWSVCWRRKRKSAASGSPRTGQNFRGNGRYSSPAGQDLVHGQCPAELGVEILAAGTQNSTLEDFYRMKGLMHKDAKIIEDTSTAGLCRSCTRRCRT